MTAQLTEAHLTARRERSGRLPAFLGFVAFCVAGAAVPWLTADAPFALLLASYAVIAALVALSLDMLTGKVGLLSFGHAAWHGFGAYGAGLLAKTVGGELLVVVPLTVLAAALVSTLVGLVLVRQVGKTFAILTLAFSQIMFALVFTLPEVTGGEDGLQGVPVATVLGAPVTRPDVWYWLLFGILVAAVAMAFHLNRSPIGKSWLAIRGNTERARFIGIPVVAMRLAAYVLSASLAALAGGLFVMFNGAASPDLLSWFESGKVLMYVVLGGVGTIIGPVFGAIAFTVAEHYVSSHTSAWLIYFGGLFVIIVIVAPGGLFGAVSALWSRAARRNAEDRA